MNNNRYYEVYVSKLVILFFITATGASTSHRGSAKEKKDKNKAGSKSLNYPLPSNPVVLKLYLCFEIQDVYI